MSRDIERASEEDERMGISYLVYHAQYWIDVAQQQDNSGKV
jgi:hypothetical protein